MAKKMRWRGLLNDGSEAPLNSDKARLDFMGRHPDKVKNMKKGVMATSMKAIAKRYSQVVPPDSRVDTAVSERSLEKPRV